jgi:hypothetical protein
MKMDKFCEIEVPREHLMKYKTSNLAVHEEKPLEKGKPDYGNSKMSFSQNKRPAFCLEEKGCLARQD